ncbi:hypothetical protein B0H13DRAFT_2324811 [Mycena leptocephala]|nr:hypothetical protein B0H13DRAFT_2324811 [Mycena leptocephala]
MARGGGGGDAALSNESGRKALADLNPLRVHRREGGTRCEGEEMGLELPPPPAPTVGAYSVLRTPLLHICLAAAMCVPPSQRACAQLLLHARPPFLVPPCLSYHFWCQPTSPRPASGRVEPLYMYSSASDSPGASALMRNLPFTARGLPPLPRRIISISILYPALLAPRTHRPPQALSLRTSLTDIHPTYYPSMSSTSVNIGSIQMLVNIKYGIPGEIPAEAMEHPEPSEVQPEDGGGGGEDGAGYIFLLNCRTFDIWAYEPAPNTSRPVPNIIEELVALVSAASSSPSSLPFPPNIPVSKLTPDPAGESALARILARDASVIPLLESYFLGKKWKEAIDGCGSM